jgi:hypothetical protein
VSHSRLYKWLYLILFPVGLLIVYRVQLAHTNLYLGFRDFPIDPAYLITAIAALFVAGMLMPAHLRKPSDFFAALYSLFIIIPYATLYPIRTAVEPEHFTLYFLVLILPLLAVRLVTACAPAVRFPALIKQQWLVWLVALLCIAGMALAFSKPPPSAGFDLESVYVRRLEGRSVFPAGSLVAYLNAAVVNGFSPFLAFIAGWRGKSVLLGLAVVAGVSFFYLLGLKAPLLFIVLAYIVGYAVRKRQVDGAIVTIYALVLAAFVLFVVEYMLFEFSLVAEYFIRRAFAIPPFFIAAYFEFMSSEVATGWSMMDGVITVESITFLVGESFLGMPDLNANTNTFIYQLAAGGVPMYVLTVGLVAVVFAVLDSAYKCRRNAALMYLGFVYAILLAEQAATTALLSSGMGLLILLNVLSGAGHQSGARARVPAQADMGRGKAGRTDVVDPVVSA